MPALVHNKQTNQFSYRREIYRKLIHLGALVIPGGYYYLDLSRNEALAIMIPITIGMLIIDTSRLRGWQLWHILKPVLSPVIREHEMRGNFTGAFYILATSCLAIGFYDKPIAMAALAFIMIGDAAAALVGRKFGRHKFKSKSLEGSLAFLITAIVVAIIAPELRIGIGLIGAVVATITEAVSFSIDDNTAVPLVSGLVMQMLNKIQIF